MSTEQVDGCTQGCPSTRSVQYSCSLQQGGSFECILKICQLNYQLFAVPEKTKKRHYKKRDKDSGDFNEGTGSLKHAKKEKLKACKFHLDKKPKGSAIFCQGLE